MLSRFKYVLGCMVFLLAGFMNGDPSQAEIRYDWDFYELGDPAGWAAYFRQSARIRLGAEHRLPNGVSWRLLTDVNSGIAIPRLTWMPDKQRLRTANHLLDIVQGREMLVEQEGRKGIDAENEFNVKAGGYPISVKHGLTQWEVGLTYVGSRLMSLTSAAVVWSEDLNTGQTFDTVTLRSPFAEPRPS